MSRENATVKGVFVPSEGMTEENIEYWRSGIKKEYEAADSYGNSKTVEFEETVEEDGKRYFNYWVV